MGTIYAATRDVSFGRFDSPYDHLYLVYDPDNQPRNGNEEVIRGGPSWINFRTIDNELDDGRGAWWFGEMIVEPGVPIGLSEDHLGNDTPAGRQYTALDLVGMVAGNVWSFMISHAEEIKAEEIQYVLLIDIIPFNNVPFVYGGVNSNTVFSSVVSSALAGDVKDYLPDGGGSWPGYVSDLSAWVDVPRDGYDLNGMRYKLGTGGDDRLVGGSRSKDYVLDGGDGEDTIDGNRGDDVIHGGPGRDILRGNGGRDIFAGSFDDLDGDKIKDFDSNDRIEIVWESSPAIVQARLAGNDLEIYRLPNARDEASIEIGFFSGYEPIVSISGERTFVSLQQIAGPEEDPDDQRDQPTRIGTAASDVLQGDNFDDVIVGYAGNDVINGSEGSDVAYGNSDHDIIRAGTKTTGGVDSLFGGSGSDTLYGSVGPDNLYGQWDLEQHMAAPDNSFDDDKNDRIEAGGGDDVAYGGNGADEIYGGSGDDFLAGLASNDGIYGDAGDDIVYGNSGHDHLEGGDGNDTMYGGSGTDIMLGAAGNDKMVALWDLDTYALAGFANGYDAENIDWIFGGDGNDTIIGGAGSDDLRGFNGNDLIYGLWGDDATVQGGSGDDSLYGNGGNDTLRGDAGDDFLLGGADDDALYGGDGDDILEAMHGTDMLNGEAGADTFVLYGGNFGSHFVEDFSAAEGDKISIDNRVSGHAMRLGAEGVEIYDINGDMLMLTLKGVFDIADVEIV